jgi:hypothetical protein
VKPRIQIPSPTDAPVADSPPPPMAPAISQARSQLRRIGFRMRGVDPVTTELVRIRNARFQHCNY